MNLLSAHRSIVLRPELARGLRDWTVLGSILGAYE
jgi:hypothetical protein